MLNNLFQVVILAGGLATRLRPLTETIPKSLVEVNGEPFIAHQLRLLRQKNIKKVTLCLGYLGEKVQEYVDNGDAFGLEVTYSFDGSKLLGTAGAVKQALPLLDDNFFILYGDSYLPCDFTTVQQTFTHNKKPALMTVYRNLGQGDKSNVEFVNHEIRIYDKKNPTPQMHHIDYGLGVFNKKAFNTLANEKISDLAALYQNLLQQQQLAAHEVTEQFYEVGSFTGITELSIFLSQKNSHLST